MSHVQIMIAVVACGVVGLIWEWRSLHSANGKHGGGGSAHHHAHHDKAKKESKTAKN